LHVLTKVAITLDFLLSSLLLFGILTLHAHHPFTVSHTFVEPFDVASVAAAAAAALLSRTHVPTATVCVTELRAYDRRRRGGGKT
jgi:hypothetical protein